MCWFGYSLIQLFGWEVVSCWLLEICENPFNPFNPWRKILSPALSLRGTKQSNHIIFSYFFVFPTQEESHYFFVNCLVWFLLRWKDKRVINSVKSVVKKTFSICQSEFISDSNLSSLDAETSSAWQNGILWKSKRSIKLKSKLSLLREGVKWIAHRQV